MEIRIDLNGKKRKDLATAIGELLGLEVVYLKAPSYAYEIGEGVVLDRNNTLIISGNINVQELVEHLEESGFVVEGLPDTLEIQMPLDGFDDVALQNLNKLLVSKMELIKKALYEQKYPNRTYKTYGIEIRTQALGMYFMGLSLKEISKKLGIPAGTIACWVLRYNKRN